MNLTYKVSGDSYTIFSDGVAWIKQESYIPYPGKNIEESAQNHIDVIVTDMNRPMPPSPEEQMAKLKVENQELKLALAEMAEAQEQQRIETQLALAEIAEVVTGGV